MVPLHNSQERMVFIDSIIALVHCHECRHFNKGCQLPRQYCPAVDRDSVLCRVIATCGRGSYLFNSRGQSNSQPVCKVWTGPPPSPPDLKGLLLASRGPFLATIITTQSGGYFACLDAFHPYWLSGNRVYQEVSGFPIDSLHPLSISQFLLQHWQ